MYPLSGRQQQGLATHAAQLRADPSGEMFRSLEESLEQAIDNVTASNGRDRTDSAASRLDTAFDAARTILGSARALR